MLDFSGVKDWVGKNKKVALIGVGAVVVGGGFLLINSLGSSSPEKKFNDMTF